MRIVHISSISTYYSVSFIPRHIQGMLASVVVVVVVVVVILVKQQRRHPCFHKIQSQQSHGGCTHVQQFEDTRNRIILPNHGKGWFTPVHANMSTVVVDKVDGIYVMTLVRNSQKQSQTKFREAIATNNKQKYRLRGDTINITYLQQSPRFHFFEKFFVYRIGFIVNFFGFFCVLSFL